MGWDDSALVVDPDDVGEALPPDDGTPATAPSLASPGLMARFNPFGGGS